MVGEWGQLGKQRFILCDVLPVHHLCPGLLLGLYLPSLLAVQLGCRGMLCCLSLACQSVCCKGLLHLPSYQCTTTSV